MAKYIVGQTYKAVLSDGSKKSFKILEQGHDVYADLYCICWEDGYKETVYKLDMDQWVEKAQEVEEAEKYGDSAKQDKEEIENIESLKALRDLHLHNAKVLDNTIAKLEKRTLGTANT